MRAGFLISDAVYYVLCAFLSLGVLFGIKMMSKVEKANLGNKISAASMFFAVVLTLIRYNIWHDYILWVGMALGGFAGVYLVKKSKMMLMPQLVALLNGVGGIASALAAALLIEKGFAGISFESFAAAVALAVGALTFSGSLVAAGKLHRILPQKPVSLKGHSIISAALCVSIIVCIVLMVLQVKPLFLMPELCLILSLVFGVVFAIRVGGADMPITISLLNSSSGLAAAIAGMAVKDILLVSVGAIVGASGLLLTQIMCKAMNRSLSAILFAKKASPKADDKKDAKEEQEEARSPSAAEEKPAIQIPDKEDAGAWLLEAQDIIIVPGYGMAISQAQAKLKMLADSLESKGKKVRYAIHPVAGRMPGHMNVLLAEVDVSYDALYEMESIDADFESCDLVLVVGANDVMNPAANTAEGTPIYGMPVLSVSKAERTIICNFDDKPGYAGVPNPMYEPSEKVMLLLGDAKESLDFLIKKAM